jgi:Tfp pilus assembly protein PilF
MFARAQGSVDVTGTNGRHTISGRIFFPSGRSADYRPKVRLEATNTGTLSVLADANGHFGFRGLAPGNYSIIVEGGEEYETATDSVYIDTDPRSRRMAAPGFTRAYTVTIHLLPKRGAGTKAGVLNAALSGVPEAARSHYLKALEAAATNDSRKAVELLKTALYHHPNFPLALNELGVQYLKLGQPDKAADAVRSALKLVPDNVSARLNYGIALLNKKEFAEAEVQLRQVLQKNDASPTAHMYLGIALINLRNHAEAEKELQRAISTGGQSLSQAHYYLAGIYWKKGETKRAADELDTYLKLAPNAPDAERIRTTIKELRK